MKITHLTPELFHKNRKHLVNFIRHNGDKRITQEAINWVRKASPEVVNEPETIVLAAVEDKQIVGLLVAVRYGIDESFIVVHRNTRNHHIAKQMVSIALSEVSKIYGRIATDNIPSLKVCLDNGMVAFHLFTGPTGKPTLWVGAGEWTKEDVL